MRTLLCILMGASLAACGGAEKASTADAERRVIESIMGMYQAFQQRDLPKVGQYLTADSTCYDAKRSRLADGTCREDLQQDDQNEQT